MAYKKILFLFFSFIFLISFSSAVATISGVPNIIMDVGSYHQFDVNTYASGHQNSSTLLSFINPDNNANVVLYGDTGGTHSNSYFSVTLNTGGLIQIASNNNPLTQHSFLISVGNNYQTQAGDSFFLTISGVGGGGTTSNGETISTAREINLLNYFSGGPYNFKYSDKNFSYQWNASNIGHNYFTMPNGNVIIETKIDDWGQRIYISRLGYSSAESGVVNLNVTSGATTAIFYITTAGVFNDQGYRNINGFYSGGPVDFGGDKLAQGNLILDKYFVGGSMYLSGMTNSTIDNYGFYGGACRVGGSLNNITQEGVNFDFIGINTPNQRYTSVSWNNYNTSSNSLIINAFVSPFTTPFNCNPKSDGFVSTSITTNRLYISGNSTSSSTSSSDVPDGSLVDIVKPFGEGFGGLFPDAITLTQKQRWNRVLATLLAPWILFFFVLFMSQGKVPLKLLSTSGIVINLICGAYLASIGYIPIVVLVSVGLLSGAISYLRYGR